MGLGLTGMGALIALPVLVHWVRTAEVLMPAQWIFAGTLFVLGLEAIFTSFLVGILDLRRENGRSG